MRTGPASSTTRAPPGTRSWGTPPTPEPPAAGRALLLLAAVALEAAGGAVIDIVGDGAAYVLVSLVEEAAESVGACLLADGVLRGVEWRTDAGGVSLAPVPASRGG